MRTVRGEIVLPADTPTTAALVRVEVRDVTRADVPSAVVAQQRLAGVRLQPQGRIPFALPVPEVESNRSLSLRVHISRDDDERVKGGDLLTVQEYPIPSAGTPTPLAVAVATV